MAALYIQNESESFLTIPNTETHLIECLSKIVTGYPPKDIWDAGNREPDDEECGGLYFGPTGLSYLFLHLSKSHPDLWIEGKLPKQWAVDYISGTRPATAVDVDHCGTIIEEVSYCAVAATVFQDISYVHRLLALIDSNELLSSSGANEMVYGRAGFLYLLRLIRTWLPETAELVNPAIVKLIECILANGPNWIFKGRHFIGVGHGDMGIITQIILCDQSCAPRLEAKVSELLDQQTESGSWQFAREDPKELVQFCHGAPGFVISLLAIRDYFPSLQNRIDEVVSRARECTWKEGLIKKVPNLCHGATGNAFAFPPGPRRDHFLAYGTSEKIQEGKDKGWWASGDYGFPYGLTFGSLPGAAWGYMARDRDEKEFITYNDV